MKITPEQCKSARQLLGWQRSELAYDSGMSQTDISLFEAGKGRRAFGEQIAIQLALEQGGVEFLSEKGDGPGVRLRKSK
jgi:transcriptional regulator with XRE-family HTH domain